MARPEPGGGGLIQRLLGQRPETSGALYVAEIGPAFRVDPERIKRELRLEEAAQNDGRDNRPASTDKELNDFQTRLVGWIVTGIRRVNQLLAEAMGEAVAAAGKQAPQPIPVDHARVEIDSHVAHTLAERRGELVALRERELEALRDLNYFRRRHGLHRSASYRESGLLFWAILIGMFVLESFINAFLLRRISEQGWVGGVVLAGVISLVNVALGVWGGGVGWRLIGHRFRQPRAIGWGVSIAAIVLAFWWNIYAAHFREVAETAVNTGTNGAIAAGAADALGHLKTYGLFGLHSLFSWGLFALGLLVHLAASREAWDDMADRYWDYKRYDRAYNLVRMDYEDAVADAKEDAARAARQVLADLESIHADQGHRRDRITAVAELGARRLAEAREAEAEWMRQGNALLKAYRDENLHVRSDPPPPYFARYPTPDDYRRARPALEEGEPPAPDPDVSRADAERAQAQLGQLAEAAVKIHDANTTAVAGLRSYLAEALTRLQADIDAMKQTVDREADANLHRRAPEIPEEAHGAPA